MTSAIERVERFFDGQTTRLLEGDLTELVRLAKLGERVEQCGPAHTWHVSAEDLLAWLKGES